MNTARVKVIRRGKTMKSLNQLKKEEADAMKAYWALVDKQAIAARCAWKKWERTTEARNRAVRKAR